MPQFGIYLPNVGWERFPTPDELVEFAVEAERSGFDSVWVEDRLLHGRVGVLDALSTLTYVAARTARVKLGTSVLLVNLRNPLTLAKAIATLDYLSGGRVIVGASLGGRPEEYPAAGIPARTRVTRFAETIRAMRALWGEGPAGELKQFRLGETAMEPRPLQARIPVLVGGRVEAVFERAATLGDGWLASSTTTADEFARGWAQVLEHAATAGRVPESMTAAKFVYVHVDDDERRALAVLEQRLPRYYDFPYDAAGLALHGPPERVVEGARRLLDAGVDTLIFATVADERAQLARLAREVLPALVS